MHWTGPWDGWWMSGMWIFPVIMLTVMLLVVYLIFGRGGGSGPPCWGNDGHRSHLKDSETPVDILKKRYAKGEITRDEFELMKKTVKGDS